MKRLFFPSYAVPYRVMCTLIVSLDFVISCFYLTQGNAPFNYLVYASIRIVFYMIAWILGVVRLSKQFYFAGLREMPVDFYWANVLLILIAIRALFAYIFSTNTLFIAFEGLLFAFAVLGVTTSYQSQWWLSSAKEDRKRRIDYLLGHKKANLAIEEVQAIQPLLEQKGLAASKPPKIWRLTIFVIGLIIGTTFNAIAKEIVDALVANGYLRFTNVLPPF